MKKLGILGGMGPLATALFYEMIVKRTKAECDQDHFNTLIYSNASIPKRVEYLLGQSEENPLNEMIASAKLLEDASCDLIAMPCVTAHAFYKEVSESVKIPFLNMITETINYLKKENIKRVGIMASDGTISAGHLQKNLEENGIEIFLPDSKNQARIRRAIYDEIKKNKKVSRLNLVKVQKHLIRKGAQLNLIACTDLSAYNFEHPLGPKNLDMMEVLVLKIIDVMSQFRECSG